MSKTVIYRVVKEEKKRWRIDIQRKFLFFKWWKEKTGWKTFANDDGGWPIVLRFKKKKDAIKFMEKRNGSCLQQIGPFIKSIKPKGSY